MLRPFASVVVWLLCAIYAQNVLGIMVIPSPQEFIEANGYCVINQEEINVYADDLSVIPKELMQQDVFPGADLRFVARVADAEVAFMRDAAYLPEEYSLKVHPEKVLITCSDKRGAIYALQTLNQLACAEGYKCVEIKDGPLMPWRGFMLDSGRQYQSVETIKKYIRMASMLKMNIFHWHLTEGLGWRIEIKRFPLLTQCGAFVATGEEQQGYYTQDDVRDVVAYAAERGITVVPEIDMPGHAEAALASYPELGCFGEIVEIPKSGFTKNIFCAGKDSTMLFLKGVLDEVCALFPSEYIHLGGDEAPKGNWENCPDCQARIREHNLSDCQALQRWFSSEMAKYLGGKGRKAIFWEDVIYGDGQSLPANAVIQWWNYRSHGDLALQKAREKGIPLICSTNYYTYLNFPEKPWRGYQSNRTFGIKECYCDNPSYQAFIEDDDSIVKGMTCALWTDDGVTENMIDIRLFPRILALAQQMWYRGEPFAYDSFMQMIALQKCWFENKGFVFGM